MTNTYVSYVYQSICNEMHTYSRITWINACNVSSQVVVAILPPLQGNDFYGLTMPYENSVQAGVLGSTLGSTPTGQLDSGPHRGFLVDF